jgi:hypothetical protein
VSSVSVASEDTGCSQFFLPWKRNHYVSLAVWNKPARFWESFLAISTKIKSGINSLLSPINLQLSTRTADFAAELGISNLKQAGYFDRPAFPVPASIINCDWQPVIESVKQYRADLAKFEKQEANQVGFQNDNGFFGPPDSDVLYSIIRKYQPRTFLEIGSGNSTRLVRQAIIDGGLNCRIVSIDPCPRVDIGGFADTIHKCPVEQLSAADLSAMLEPGDVLFIDSSHVSTIGSDCTYEFLQLVPALKSGVIVHIHDVTLPWDYPEKWFLQEPCVLKWNEQYLLQAMLMNSPKWKVVWPGYYLQKTLSHQFLPSFPSAGLRDATSFWFIS